MKVSFVNTFICFVNVLMEALFKVLKQNLSHVCVLGPDTFMEINTMYNIYSIIKQNQSAVWLLEPPVLRKLITYDIYSSIK